MGRRRRSSFAVLALLTALVATTPSPVSAACDGPIPSFREAIGSAETVIVGTVVSVTPRAEDPAGYASAFEMRVDHVVRGESESLVRFDRLLLQPCFGHLVVPLGAVIALALDAEAFTPAIDVNAPAFIEGRPRESQQEGWLTEPERVTLAEVFELAGTPMPTTATAPPSFPTVPLGVAILVLSAALAVRPRRSLQDATRTQF